MKLLLILILMPQLASAAFVEKSKGRKVLVNLVGLEVSKGDRLVTLKQDEKRSSYLVVLRVSKQKAIAKLLKGKAEEGQGVITWKEYLKRRGKKTSSQSQSEGNESAKKINLNLKSNLAGLLFGSKNLEIDYLFAPWAMGLSYTSLSTDSTKLDISAKLIALSAYYYFLEKEQPQDAYYLSFLAGKISAEYTVKSSASTLTESGNALAALFGYLWIWDDMNASIGAGVIYYTLGDKIISDGASITNPLNGINPTGEISIGWLF